MYNNPYLYNNYPYQGNNLFRRGNIFNQFKEKKFNWTNILNNTQKTLNLINQAIPVYYQVKPIIQNVGTVFKISHALKNSNEESIPDASNTHNSPIFFV